MNKGVCLPFPCHQVGYGPGILWIHVQSLCHCWIHHQTTQISYYFYFQNHHFSVKTEIFVTSSCAIHEISPKSPSILGKCKNWIFFTSSWANHEFFPKISQVIFLMSFFALSARKIYLSSVFNPSTGHDAHNMCPFYIALQIQWMDAKALTKMCLIIQLWWLCEPF